MRADEEKHCFDIISGADKDTFFAHSIFRDRDITLEWFTEQFMKEGRADRKTSRKILEEKAAEIMPGSEEVSAVGLLGGKPYAI